MAEVAVHFTLGTLPEDYMVITIEIPDDIKVGSIGVEDLPVGWNRFPHPPSTNKIGDSFVRENKNCVLMVPSAVTQGDFNILINPLHTDFGRIKILEIEKFPFDKRIFN